MIPRFGVVDTISVGNSQRWTDICTQPLTPSQSENPNLQVNSWWNVKASVVFSWLLQRLSICTSNELDETPITKLAIIIYIKPLKCVY